MTDGGMLVYKVTISYNAIYDPDQTMPGRCILYSAMFLLVYFTTKIHVKGIYIKYIKYKYSLIVYLYPLTSKQLTLSGPNFWQILDNAGIYDF